SCLIERGEAIRAFLIPTSRIGEHQFRAHKPLRLELASFLRLGLSRSGEDKRDVNSGDERNGTAFEKIRTVSALHRDLTTLRDQQGGTIDLSRTDYCSRFGHGDIKPSSTLRPIRKALDGLSFFNEESVGSFGT